MKSAIYFGPGDIRCGEVDDPVITAEQEMVVTVDATSICGSDLHLYRGAFDAVLKRGYSTVGHELAGRVLDVGGGVTRFKRGDRVTMPYAASCGHCYMCQVGQTVHCEGAELRFFGFGHLNGTQAEAILVPMADSHAMRVPDDLPDSAVLTLSCNLPSALISVESADVRVGESVAIVGCGPTGMMALDLVMQRGPGRIVALDRVQHRLEAAQRKGATAVDTTDANWKELALAETSGRGFDKVIEVVGFAETLQMSFGLVRAGGVISAIGVYVDQVFNLALMREGFRNVTLRLNGAANTQPFMWDALRMLERGAIAPQELFTHTFPLTEIDQAFRVFNDKADRVGKVLIKP